jgi:uncharacterized protein YegL
MTSNSSNGNGSKPTTAAVTALVQSAVQDGLAQAAGGVLVANLNDTVLMGCVGADVDTLDATEATLVTVVLDASGSMEAHRRTVVEAFNTMLTALQKSKASSNILLSTWSFSDAPTLVHGFQPVTQLQPMDLNDYRPTGSTALYDTVLSTMTGIVTYGQKLADNGVPNRRIIVVFSDGEDNVSRAKSHSVKTASKGLLAQEMYTLAYAGFGHDLKQIADEVGFKDVITTSSSESEIRKVFHQVSQSIIRVSQGATGAGGFF